MSEKKRGLIVCGGWEGHEPEKIAVRFQRMLSEINIEAEISHTLDSYADLEYLKSLQIICPIWTFGELSSELCRNVVKAVASGVGLAGNHGGMCDSFRYNTEWQFMTGGNWVSHPGGITDYTVDICENEKSPITEGLGSFPVTSEQYYLHVDPAVRVLATTRFPVEPYYHISNPPVDMPVVWTKMWGNGRVFYCSLGHTDDVFDNSPNADILMKRGIAWAAEGKDIAIREGLTTDRFISEKKNF